MFSAIGDSLKHMGEKVHDMFTSSHSEANAIATKKKHDADEACQKAIALVEADTDTSDTDKLEAIKKLKEALELTKKNIDDELHEACKKISLDASKNITASEEVVDNRVKTDSSVQKSGNYDDPPISARGPRKISNTFIADEVGHIWAEPLVDFTD